MKCAWIGDPATTYQVYSEEQRTLLRSLAGMDPTNVLTKESVLAHPEQTADTEILFSTWGMPAFTEEELAQYFPALKAVFYAAGSVQAFARPLLARKVKVFSAWAANAVPVAEYTAAQILLANKGYFTAARLCSADYAAARAAVEGFPGNYNCRVGILGAGMIGSRVLELLRAHALELLVYDPFLSEERAAVLGARKASLEEIFSTCQTISNHIANNAQTVGMLNGSLFERMSDTVTFLNTGRGAQVAEDDLCDALEKRPLATAVLDVTWPEPPKPDHRFYTMQNVVLTPHIAGSFGNEVHRMAAYMIDEYRAFVSGEPTQYEVTTEMLKTMA